MSQRGQWLRSLRGSLFLAVAVLCGACCPSCQYSGDGVIENRGCWPFPNYRVSFRSVPLSQPGAARYHLRRLPDLNASAGIEVTTRVGQTCEQLQNDPAMDGLVAIEVHDSTGRSLAHGSGRLSQWTWTYPVLQPDPSVSPQICIVYTDDLFFEPQGLRDLTLDFKVIEAGRLPTQLTPIVESYAVYSP
jgi:hypothetical protein